MNLLIILDHQRQRPSIIAFQSLCRRLRWQEPLQPLIVLGVDRATTLSFTQEFAELFYNAEEFMYLNTGQSIAAESVTSVTYLHQGYIWQRLPSTCWRLIHHPEPERLLSAVA